MADSSVHDGFVCAVDVGGGIKLDRIDLFVGIDSAGNPYYPTCRRDNAFLRAGIASLIPSDWHQFAADKNGKLVRSKAAEYRDIAPGKGLDIVLFPEVRCRRRITRPASSS
jgi:hypothetical protein